MVSTVTAGQGRERQDLVALGLVLLITGACSPGPPPLQAGTRIACGGFPTNPTLVITVDSTSASQPGTITVEELSDSLGDNAAVVEYGASAHPLRCESTGGYFEITIREGTAVAGQLRVAAARPLPITVRSADGLVRTQTSFDPSAGQPVTLQWDARK
jgi:hypothetical protein